MFENDNPRNWREDYERMAIFRVHDSLYQIKKCPICQGVIDLNHIEALKVERDNEEKGFELA